MIAPAKLPRVQRLPPRPPVGNWPPSPPPLLATITLLVLRDFNLPPVTVATTLDAPGSTFWNPMAERDRQCADDVRAYLYCLHDRRAPDPHQVEAWERFFRLHDPLVRRVVGEYRVEVSQRDDCTQEAWIAILLALERTVYDPLRGRLCAWIDKIVRNRVINFLHATRQPHLAHHPELERITCHREFDAVASYEQRETRDLVWHVLGHLEQNISAASYRIVFLRWIEGKEFSEIAVALNLTNADVRVRHCRASKRLRALMRSHQMPDH